MFFFLCLFLFFFFFFFNDTATTEIYTLSLHDALPILFHIAARVNRVVNRGITTRRTTLNPGVPERWLDRKSTRLNSSHITISYAVFCLKKKKKKKKTKHKEKNKKNESTEMQYMHHEIV